MATLSRKTIAYAAKVLERWPRTVINHFFFEHDVPSKWVFGHSKLDLVMNVLQNYERSGKPEALLTIIKGIADRADEYTRTELESHLIKDGFVIAAGVMIDAEPETAEHRSAVIALMKKHAADFDISTLQHHLDECEDLFQQGKWDASIGQCRNFVEQALKDVASAIASARGDSPNLGKPVLVRDYLEKCGFFDQAERRKLVDGVYGYLSEEGSHPGISNQSSARISKSILVAFAFYVLEKYDAFKLGKLRLH